MASQKQMLANRINAVLSTGPKNTDNTKYNAIKFGIFTKDLLIDKEILGEEISELNLLLNDLCQEYNPQSSTEWILVERIAECYWRLKRLRKAENAIITKKMTEVKTDAKECLERLEMAHVTLNCNDFPMVSEDRLIYLYNKEENRIKSIKEGSINIEKLKRYILSKKLTTKEKLDGLSQEEIKNIALHFSKNTLKNHKELLHLKIGKKELIERLEADSRLVLPEQYLINLTTYGTAIERQLSRAILLLRQIKNGLI